MSKVQNPTVEEQVATPAPETTTTTTSTEAPVVEPVEEPKVEEPQVEEPVAATEAAVETPAVVVEEPTAEATTDAAPVAKEVTPVEEGVLGYKGPGLLKSFIFQKKHFWFGSEPVEHKNLSSYLRGEKPDVANHNAAWSSHTGNGLLFFSKKASDKASPAGILNLSEASDVSEDGTVDFFFSIHGHKHTFQAANVAERDNWVATLKTKIAEAKEISESVKESETYKTSIAALAKPFSGAATPKKEAKEEKKEEKAEAKAEKKEEKAEAKEAKEEQKEENAEAKAEAKEEKKEEKAELKAEKKDRKSRSASRKGDKRTSIFGALPGFGKKEEKTEAPKDEVVASPSTEEPVVTSDASAAPVVDAPVAAEAPATTEEAAIAPAVEEPVAAAAPVEKPVEKPVPTKRNSIFGTLQSRFSNKKFEPEAVSPVVAAKDEEPVSENAPVIPAVDTTEPLTTNADASGPAETTEVPAINGETPKAAEIPMTKADKRKSSLPWLSKKDKSAATSDEETEKPKSPFAKLRATVKSKSSPKTEKTAEKPLEPTVEAKAEDKIDEETVATEAEAEAAPAATEPVVSEPVVAAPSSTTPQVSATA
ncbi:c7db0c9d-4ed0-4ee9-9f1f-bbc9863d19b5 [Sclerotinia trifoliorum]|uniref:C7db0c9d-4ed0-4ee9-9f1f-bbc9863d19b5 n=1 Tax=Sclerotinia trifoliorum TaxID=28548 RepID=A0A8H2ZPJ8_9HELO|nr:c7db0c9d-4ed0-4ee9-9f1f-bbc9863d19b5 [Sclerotinia trifoliorum]